MYFEKRPLNKMWGFELSNLAKINQLHSVEDIADFLCKEDENGNKYVEFYDTRSNSLKPLTRSQKINTVLFFPVFWLFFAPFNYVQYGHVGFKQDTKIGELISKIVGEQGGLTNSIKNGWCRKLTKQEFIERLKEIKIYTVKDLSIAWQQDDVIYNYNDLIIEKLDPYYESEISKDDQKTKMNRFNELWFVPILCLIYPFYAVYSWLRYDRTDFKKNGLIEKCMKKLIYPPNRQ